MVAGRLLFAFGLLGLLALAVDAVYRSFGVKPALGVVCVIALVVGMIVLDTPHTDIDSQSSEE